MRLKHGSEAWREHLKVEISRLKELLKQKQRGDHSRYYADSAIKSMAEAIGGISGLTLTFSLVRPAEPKITYRNEKTLQCGFYTRDDKLVHLCLRGDEYWDAAQAILDWFNVVGRRYMRKGDAAEQGEEDPGSCDKCQSPLFLVGMDLRFVKEGEKGYIGRVQCQACKHQNMRRIINHNNPERGRK